MLVSLKWPVLVVGLILGFHGSAGAQSTEHRIAFFQSPPSPMIVFSPRHALQLASSVPLIQHQVDFHDGYGFRITANYRPQDSDSLSPLQETNTSFATESRVPVAQIWGARLQVNFFVTTLYTRNIMFGPLASNEAFRRTRQLRSVDLYGMGVSVPLGRGARVEGSRSLWRTVSRIVHGDDWPQLSSGSLQGSETEPVRTDN